MRVMQKFPKRRKMLYVTHKIHEDQKGNFRFTECMPIDAENLIRYFYVFLTLKHYANYFLCKLKSMLMCFPIFRF